MDGPLDLMEDTEDDMEEMEQRFMGSMKQPHKYYIEQHEQRSGGSGGQGQPRARSESPFAKGGRVRPEDFISVRRQRCGSSDTFTNPEFWIFIMVSFSTGKLGKNTPIFEPINDQSIASTKTKYIKLNTKTQIFFVV